MTSAPDTLFTYTISAEAPGRILPQRIGSALWLPMLIMALAAFAFGFVLAVVRADAIASGSAVATIAALNHTVPGFMFLGFAAVFAAISFAIARILGEFRVGGGAVQQAAGGEVHTLATPRTAKLFIVGMALAMMTLIVTVVLHFVAAAAIVGGSANALANAEAWAVQLEGVRRAGIALYLFSITLGLASIIEVLRFQTARIGELADAAR